MTQPRARTTAGRYRLRHSFWWLLHPLAYLAFVLTRGALLALALIGLDHLRPSHRDGHNAISSPTAGPLE